jgi:hypothetical protein
MMLQRPLPDLVKLATNPCDIGLWLQTSISIPQKVAHTCVSLAHESLPEEIDAVFWAHTIN